MFLGTGSDKTLSALAQPSPLASIKESITGSARRRRIDRLGEAVEPVDDRDQEMTPRALSSFITLSQNLAPFALLDRAGLGASAT